MPGRNTTSAPIPYCFRLPALCRPRRGRRRPRRVTPATPVRRSEDARALQMGQAPGTHWYHAHKHGSTTINVANGMTGAFIIEGGYDDALNKFYGVGWTGPQSWTRRSRCW